MKHRVVFAAGGSSHLRLSRSDRAWTVHAVRAALALDPIQHPCEVEILYTDSEGIQPLNAEHRGKDEPTDVLSFPLYENFPVQGTETMTPDPDSGRVALGSVVINVPQCRAQALEYGHSFRRELCYLTVHSVLHLLGYDHESDESKRLMREKEDRAMDALRLPLMKRSVRVFGFREAGRGLTESLQDRNVRVHLAAAASVTVLGVYLRIDRVSWALAALCFGLVIGLELCNTAIETLCDKVESTQDNLIRRCKDIAAGAVLAASVASMGVAAVIFSKPALWQSVPPVRTVLLGLGVAAADALFIFSSYKDGGNS